MIPVLPGPQLQANSAMEFDEFISQVEEVYKPLEGLKFEAICEEKRNTSAVATGGPRDILTVQDGSTISTLRDIIHKMDKLQREYNRLKHRSENTEIVWKGITNNYLYGVQLWVPPYDGDEEEGSFEFQVTNIEVLTDLQWVKDYIALVNIEVKKEK